MSSEKGTISKGENSSEPSTIFQGTFSFSGGCILSVRGEPGDLVTQLLFRDLSGFAGIPEVSFPKFSVPNHDMLFFAWKEMKRFWYPQAMSTYCWWFRDPGNHLGWCWNLVNNGEKYYQPQRLQDFFHQEYVNMLQGLARCSHEKPDNTRWMFAPIHWCPRKGNNSTLPGSTGIACKCGFSVGGSVHARWGFDRRNPQRSVRNA